MRKRATSQYEHSINTSESVGEMQKRGRERARQSTNEGEVKVEEVPTMKKVYKYKRSEIRMEEKSITSLQRNASIMSMQARVSEDTFERPQQSAVPRPKSRRMAKQGARNLFKSKDRLGTSF